MIAQLATVTRPAALYLPRRQSAATSSPRQAIVLITSRRRKVAFRLTLAASALAGVFATSTIMDWVDSHPKTSAREAVRNETLVYRVAPPPAATLEQSHSEHSYSEQVEGSDQLDNGDLPSHFPRAVQTVRFVNPDVPVSERVTAGFVAFSPDEGATAHSNKESILPRKRSGSIMDQVDD